MSNERGQDPDTPPTNYAPPNAYAQQQGYAGAGQPYIGQSYIQPQPAHNYGPPRTTSHTTNVTPPAGFEVVEQNPTENPTAKKLNKASAILSGILFGLTIVGLIVGPVAKQERIYGYGSDIMIIMILGVIGAVFLLSAMLLTCITACSNNANKRAMLIGSTVMYCASVILLLSWAGYGSEFGLWMLFFLVVAFGALALAIMSGISCSKYRSTTLITYGGVPQAMVIGGGPQSVVMGGTQPGYGQPQQTVNLEYAGYDQPQSAMTGNTGQQQSTMTGNAGYDQPQSAMTGNPGQQQSLMTGNPEYTGYDQ